MNAIRTYVLATDIWDHNLHFPAIAAYIIALFLVVFGVAGIVRSLGKG